MMRENLKTNCHEYIAVYVDDLYIATQNLKILLTLLKSKLREMQNYLVIRELIIPMIQVGQWFVNSSEELNEKYI